MIITLTKAKRLLQLSDDNSYDVLLTELIPHIQGLVTTYCNTNFPDDTIRILASITIAFVNGTPATITDSDSNFIDAKFTAPTDVIISGSEYNDKIVSVDSLVAGTLTLSAGESLVDEDAGRAITLTKVKYPTGIELPVTDLLYKYLFLKGRLTETESLPGGYSVKYKTVDQLLKQFMIYRKPF